MHHARGLKRRVLTKLTLACVNAAAELTSLLASHPLQRPLKLLVSPANVGCAFRQINSVSPASFNCGGGRGKARLDLR